MFQLPKLQELPNTRVTADTFLGVNYAEKIGTFGNSSAAIEFAEMRNLTGEKYPILSTRRHRGTKNTVGTGNVKALIVKDALCYVQGNTLYMNDYPILNGLDVAGKKSLVGMGAYIIVLPDWKYVNTEKTSDQGSIDATVTLNGTENSKITIEMCNFEGDAITIHSSAGGDAPENPEEGWYWIDTSSGKPILKQYSEKEAIWSVVGTTYVRIPVLASAAALLNAGDGVTVTGADGIEGFSGSAVIQKKVEENNQNYFVFIGILETQTVEIGNDITITRSHPAMDFVIESNNRLWGCRYGLNNDGSKTVNEIYASKLGDFKNWNCFQGVSTDSYAASVGTDGAFTGAYTHLGYPIFFKENCIHKVYGSYPANYQIQTTQARGVKRGCEKSIATVDERLFYQSTADFCVYDGSLPSSISSALANRIYSDTVACAHAGRYYVSAIENGKPVFMVFDAKTGLWHVEDDLRVTGMASVDDQLYMISDGDIVTEFGRDIFSTKNIGTEESPNVKSNGETKDGRLIEWSAQTGVIGFASPDRKYITRINSRMELAAEANVSIFAQYDSKEEWEHLATFSKEKMQTFVAMVRPKRCDHLRIKLVGLGDVKIYGMTFTTEGGTDR